MQFGMPKTQETSRDINEDIKKVEEFEKMSERCKELEKMGNDRDEEEDDEYYVLKGRLEKAENDENIIMSWDGFLMEYRDLPTATFQGDGNDEDEMTILPNGKAIYLKKIPDYDYDTNKYNLIEGEGIKEILERGKKDYEKQIEKLNEKKNKIDEVLNKLQ